MRITGGQWRGRMLKTPGKGQEIRPSADQTRETLFNLLYHGKWKMDTNIAEDPVAGAHVLDVFCGTGSLGLEALSRGAEFCTFIDSNRSSLDLARDNAEKLGAAPQSRFLLKDARRAGSRPQQTPPADLVFMDPPYGRIRVEDVLDTFAQGGWLSKNVLILVERDKVDGPDFPKGFQVLHSHLSGRAALYFLTLKA